MKCSLLSQLVAVLSVSAMAGTTNRVTTVDELLSALETAGKNDVVELAAGDYLLPEIPRSTNDLVNAGCSHISVACRLKGCGETREATRLIGRGAYRIMTLQNSGIVENLTLSNGAAVTMLDGASKSTSGGGAFAYGTLTNCLIVGCSAANGGGLYSGTAYDTVFVDNSATGYGGGVHSAKLYGCIVTNNASSNNGGGAYAVSYATNTFFMCNKSQSSGGGIGSGTSGRLEDCTIAGNAALGSAGCGGGVYSADVENPLEVVGGRVSSNFANKGGGIYGSVCRGAILADNVAGLDQNGDNANATALIGCEITGTGVSWGSAFGCVFHDIGGTVELTGNPHKTASVAIAIVYYYYPNVTNCLFRNNAPSSALIKGTTSQDKTSTLVNCTVVSNTFAYTFSGFAKEAYPLSVENCLFWGNCKANKAAQDINFQDSSSGKITFSHTAYGATTMDLAPYSDGSLWRFGDDSVVGTAPLFTGEPDAPYALSEKSKLLGIGRVAAWMASAKDIRGKARLTDGMVDLGCYQCHPRKGFLLLFR